MRNTIIDEIERQAKENNNISVVTADLGYSVLENFQKNFPDKFYNVGISEQFMAAAAAGISIASGDAVFTYSIGNFATLRCIEQIRNDVCYHDANVKIIAVGGGFSYGQLGMSHHATEDIAMMRSLPNMRVFTPADPEEALEVVRYSLSVDGPCYIRLARRGEPILYSKTQDIDICRIQQISTGSDIAIMACGPVLGNVIAAEKKLRNMGYSVAVYSVPCVKPIDYDTVINIASQVKMMVTVEEHQIIGGLFGAVSEILVQSNHQKAAVYPMGLKDTYTSIVGSHEYLCDYYGISETKIVDFVLSRWEVLNEGCNHRSK